MINYKLTNHSYISVRKNAFFLDWRTQPRNYKLYPHFYQSFNLSNYEELKDFSLIGGITFEKEYPDGKYYLRTVPSAGGLYPCEVYVQVRNIKGMISGVYHYEPLKNRLTLLEEIENEGVEYYFKNTPKQDGFLFLISSVYFRSSWKYRDRSIRYILLDAGHQLGAIYSALFVMQREFKINFDFDKLALNDVFGFEGYEMFLVSAFSSSPKDKEVKKLKQNLPFVSGADYLERNSSIENDYKNSATFEDKEIDYVHFFEDREVLKSAIINRRSIRAFKGLEITKEDFEFMFKNIFEFASLHNIEIYYTIHNIVKMQKGLYKNVTLLKEGDFSDKSGYLALEQKLGSQSAVTLYFTSDEKEKIQKVNILSGFLAHILYLKSTMRDIGCSGIGAYYDEEAKEFLGTSNNILYMLAIGR